MSYSYPRTRLQQSLVYRLNDARGGTSEARWTPAQIDSAITTAIRMAEPVGYVTFLDRTYPAMRWFLPNGNEIGATSIGIIDVLRVESFAAGRRTILGPQHWTFTRNEAPFVTPVFTPEANETLRTHVRLIQDPDASTLSIDQDMLEEFALSILYELYVVFGSESTTQDDEARSQQHKIAGQQIKDYLVTLQYPNVPMKTSKPTTAPS